MKKKIIIISIAAAIVIAGIVTAIVLTAGNNSCKNHVDSNNDGLCDNCGEITAQEPNYEDNVEAISKYSITVKDGEGYSVDAPASVIKGNSFSFTVSFSNYFDSTNAAVKVNGNTVTAEDGKYTVKNVTDDVEISVTGLVRKYYGVAKLACLGASVLGDDRVAVDGDYTFSLEISDKASGTPVVKANGNVIEPVSGVYTVSKPNSNLVIEVSGITVPTVEVIGHDTDAYTLKYNPTVVGDSLSFSVHINSDYENHVPLTVKVNGTVIEAVNGIYTLENAPETVSITVDGISLRQKITLNFENCDLAPTTIYQATLWQGITPTRDGYIFGGWNNASGSPAELDFMADMTLYASWLTEDEVDYVRQLPIVANKIRARYTQLGGAWWKLNPSDKALVSEYNELLAHHTDFEKTRVNTHQNVKEFLEKTAYISDIVVSKNGFYGAYENAVMLFFTADGEYQNKGASNVFTLSGGDVMDGIRYNIQNKNANEDVILDYELVFGKYNFKNLCERYGKVTFWLSSNAYGATVSVAGEDLFEAAENTSIPSGGKCALYRVDIQDKGIFVNGQYLFDLSDSVYAGESDFTIDVHRLDIPEHQYAYIQISNIYTGASDPSLLKILKTGETFKISGMLSASWQDSVTGLNTYPSRTDFSSLVDGDAYNIQKKDSATEQIILDYQFTVKAFDYSKYCKKYGSVTIQFANNYAGATVRIGSSLIFTTKANETVSVTIKDGKIFVKDAYVCDLSADVYSGASALVIDVHRLEEHTYSSFHISNLVAGTVE